MQKQQSKVRELMIKQFIESLKKNLIPWQKGWDDYQTPYNPVSKTKYKGINSFWLMCVAHELKFDDPRWVTFKQAQKKGWTIKKGSKGTLVEFWAPYDTVDKKIVGPKEINELIAKYGREDALARIYYMARSYKVFNASQVEGIPELKKKEYNLSTKELLEIRDTLIGNMDVNFSEGGGIACYIPALDKIEMPRMNAFHSDYEYMATFLHESAHATSHSKRLNRPLKGQYGSMDYAKEELRAEIASAFTSAETGIKYEQNSAMENHTAYIQNWIKVLENEPKELFNAIKDAEKISDYLLEKGEFERLQKSA